VSGFDDPAEVMAKAAILEAAELHEPAPKRRPKKNEAQEARIRALQRDGFTVAKGPTGLTVFRWGWR